MSAQCYMCGRGETDWVLGAFFSRTGQDELICETCFQLLRRYHWLIRPAMKKLNEPLPVSDLSMALVNNERMAALLQRWLCDPQSLDADEVELTLLDCGYAPAPESESNDD